MSLEPLNEEGFPWAWEHFKFIAFRDALLDFQAENTATAAALRAALADAELLYDEVVKASIIHNTSHCWFLSVQLSCVAAAPFQIFIHRVDSRSNIVQPLQL